jgi:hypothetical protein
MAKTVPYNKPSYRKLRGYAFDPITSLDQDTADINQITYQVPWEDNLKEGPEGEYIKVIDRDPGSNKTYAPVDLNKPAILAADGLAPSETNPQFHQQMVYAVTMTTIKNFEKALGSKVMWSPIPRYDGKKFKTEFVRRLFVYPHAIRDQNAYYSPERKALLFGYYNAEPADAGIFLPGGIVYSCLSHDIVAHETTHALLDGMFPHFMEPTHPDVGGFHEGFSDIVALLQHFTYPEIVKNQIRLSKGRLDTENLLGKLAVEFGQSTGEYKSLRDAIGKTVDGVWIRRDAKTSDYERNIECHERGALLVAAVFDAFLAIYKNRTADLLRIATGGSGNMPPGDIHPDLVARLADEASKTASHVLNMCVRALDYCPPVDLCYGDYLRALITADRELVSNDEYHYRVAFINAFRKRGIFPEGVPNLSVDTLSYRPYDEEEDVAGFSQSIAEFLRPFKEQLAYKTDRKAIFDETQKFIGGDQDSGITGLHAYLFSSAGVARNAAVFEELTGLIISRQFKNFGIRASKSYGSHAPSINIPTMRLFNKTGPDGNVLNRIVMTIVESADVSITSNNKGDLEFLAGRRRDADTMIFRGGCTLIFDLDDLTLKHAIKRPIYDPNGGKKRKLNEKRLQMQYRCMKGDLVDKIGLKAISDGMEPFAALHSPKNTLL